MAMDLASSVESFWEPDSFEQLVSPAANATVLITTNNLVHCIHQTFTGSVLTLEDKYLTV
ncbi:Uncharacterised protein [Mycobacteroides abscessus subsp. massiliense]|nr:Uncharacterised protein [Mycobacteroides abscessus subsp. massiliense]